MKILRSVKIFILKICSSYSPTYFHHHISFLKCCGVFLFVLLIKKKNLILRFVFSYKSHGLFPLHISTSILVFCSAVEFSSFCFLSKNQKEKEIILSFLFCFPLSHFFSLFFLMCFCVLLLI